MVEYQQEAVPLYGIRVVIEYDKCSMRTYVQFNTLKFTCAISLAAPCTCEYIYSIYMHI